MKVWFLKSKWGKGGKFFFTEQSYLKATAKTDKRQLFILEMTEGGMESGAYMEALLLSRERENQLSTILGESDKFIPNYLEFKKLFEQLCPDETKGWVSKKDALRALQIINDKKSFSNYVSQPRVRKFFLYNVSDSVEWYSALLKCHNFKSIETTLKNVVSEQRIKNFEEAKLSLKKKK